MRTIYFVGDAILDNFYWLNDKKRDLKEAVTSLGFNVINYAVDETKMSNIFSGIEPKDELKKSRLYPYPVQKDGKIYQIKSLLKFLEVHGSNKDDMVVLSIGGLDVQANGTKIFFGIDNMIGSMANEEFANTFKKLLKILCSKFDKVLLLSVYLPYLGTGASHGIYSPFCGVVVKKWAKFINSLAKELGISILDINRMINPYDRTHYSQIDDTRIGDKISKCIAECIKVVNLNYEPGKVYYTKGLDYSKISVE